MQYKTVKTKGNTTVVVGPAELGFDPSQTFTSVQASCVNLNGDTYKVEFMPVDTNNYVVFEQNVTEASAVLMSAGLLLKSVRITYTGNQANANTEATVTFIRRSF
jgi:hypothetical protein